ncbi:Unknown protein [Striga hermonthica]|uniref:Uncharacterized protein n=1 Tax=Striga hermonthica TaxID=68872 RepID=A0A9N7MSC7_STRHE|nr:Unknown protein [Striga hermonthica]
MENASNEDELIRSMCLNMWGKFDKYWGQYREVLAFGAILDPMIKFQVLEYFYSTVEHDPAKCEEALSHVKAKLYQLFEHYVNATGPGSGSRFGSHSSHTQPFLPPSTMPTLQSGSGSIFKGKRKFSDIVAFESRKVTSAGKSQLDLYLEETKLDFSFNEDLDVLEYWKSCKNRFPTLALMARDVFAIPIQPLPQIRHFLLVLVC